MNTGIAISSRRREGILQEINRTITPIGHGICPDFMGSSFKPIVIVTESLQARKQKSLLRLSRGDNGIARQVGTCPSGGCNISGKGNVIRIAGRRHPFGCPSVQASELPSILQTNRPHGQRNQKGITCYATKHGPVHGFSPSASPKEKPCTPSHARSKIQGCQRKHRGKETRIETKCAGSMGFGPDVISANQSPEDNPQPIRHAHPGKPADEPDGNQCRNKPFERSREN